MPSEPSEVLSVVDLTDPEHSPLLERLYREVLEPSFAAPELESLDALMAVLSETDATTEIAAVVDSRSEVMGGAVGDWDKATGVYLVSYLAARPGMRGRGIGTLLMDRLRSWWEARDANVVFAEVEDPRYHKPSQYGDPVARLRFYERLGARVLALPYTQPQARPGVGRVPGVLLLVFYVASGVGSASGLSAELLRNYLCNYFSDAEQLSPPDAAGEVADLFPQLLGASTVPIVAVPRYVEIGTD